MDATHLVPKLMAAKYYRMAINPAKEYERYCRVAAIESDLKNIIDAGVDMNAIPWDSYYTFFMEGFLMTVKDKSIFKGIYGVFYNKADEEKAALYEKLMKLPNNISGVEIAKIERQIVILDRFQSWLHYRGMNKKIPYVQRKAYREEIAKYDRIINGGMA